MRICSFFLLISVLMPVRYTSSQEASSIPEIGGSEASAGFVRLFDGLTFTGWEQAGNWVIEDGAFHRKLRGGSLTYTAAPVPDDFELRFEWKVSTGCNSGVYYRPGQVEYQILDNIGSPYGENARQAAASLFFCMAPARDATKPVGEWNTARIICEGTVIEHWLNGDRVLSFDYSDPKWKEYVDLLGIRGGDLTGRGGALILQDHGQDVWFRNLRWRVIPEGETMVPDPAFEPMPVTGVALEKEKARVNGMLQAKGEPSGDNSLSVSLQPPPAPDPAWTLKGREDAQLDRTSTIFLGQSPDKLACDTTLRAMPDGSWVHVMLGGGDKEPDTRNAVFLSRSRDEGKSWSRAERVDFGFPREGETIATVPTELMVLRERSTLFIATHDGRFDGWKEWMVMSEDSCHTWSDPVPAPGRLQNRTFIRNHLVARDGRILLPYQHYLNGPGPVNPRNGVLISQDSGKTWTEHGDIRLTNDDSYRGWAENNIVELADGRIAMIIRADKLGGVLYYAESTDGGVTWPEFARKTNVPNPGSKATLYGLGGDRVALLHNPDPKVRSPLALWISLDGMKTWPYQRILRGDLEGRFNYPDGFVSKDKRWIHFAFDHNRDRAIHVSARLPEIP